MTFYRRGNSLPILVCVGVLIFVGGYSYYSINELSLQLKRKDKELFISTEHERTLKDQLKVVYQHTTKLEEALKHERESHRDTKAELLNKNQDFVANLTKSRHVAMNRFNALDTDFKMLKASCEEANQNQLALQQNYARLSQDHKQLAEECKRDYKRLKDNSESESISLQSRIQDLFNHKVHFQKQAEQYIEEYRKVLNNFNECQYRLNISDLRNKLRYDNPNTNDSVNQNSHNQQTPISIAANQDLHDQVEQNQELTTKASDNNNNDDGIKRVLNGIEKRSALQDGKSNRKTDLISRDVSDGITESFGQINAHISKNEPIHSFNEKIEENVNSRYKQTIDLDNEYANKNNNGKIHVVDKNIEERSKNESAGIGDKTNSEYVNSAPQLANVNKLDNVLENVINDVGGNDKQDQQFPAESKLKFQPIRGASESKLPSEALEKSTLENSNKLESVVRDGATQLQSDLLQNLAINNKQLLNPMQHLERKNAANIKEMIPNQIADDNKPVPVVPVKNADAAVFNDKSPVDVVRRLDAQNQRMHVKEVTLEDDENGDQNLDRDVSPVNDDGVNGGNGGDEENDNDER